MAYEESCFATRHNAVLKRDRNGSSLARKKRKKAAKGACVDFVPDKAVQYKEEWRSIDEPRKHTEEHIVTITEVSGKFTPKNT